MWALWCSVWHTRFQIQEFESEHRLESHHSASAFSELRALVLKVHIGRYSSLTDVVHSASYLPGKANRVAAYRW